MKITADKLVDKRLVRRHLRSGLLTPAALDAHLASLSDASERSELITAKLANVGIEDVVAKDRGETE